MASLGKMKVDVQVHHINWNYIVTLIVMALLLIALLLNVQWHFDRMCAAVFSPRALITMQGVYCQTSLMPMPLEDLLQRHERVQKQVECMAANPEAKHLCDPRWVPAGDEGSG